MKRRESEISHRGEKLARGRASSASTMETQRSTDGARSQRRRKRVSQHTQTGELRLARGIWRVSVCRLSKRCVAERIEQREQGITGKKSAPLAHMMNHDSQI